MGELRRQSLRFTLGDYCYWQYQFEALVSDPTLTSLVERPDMIDATLGAAVVARVLRAFPAPSPLKRLSFTRGALRYVPSQEPRRYVSFAGSFQDYLQKFSAKSRSTWQRKVRKFASTSGGKIDWRCYRSAEEMAAFYEMADALSQKTYQEKMFAEGFAQVAGTKERAVALAGAGQARGYALFLNGAAVAYVYCLADEATIAYTTLGYDPTQRALSPGDVLLHLMLESLFAEKTFRYLDFGEGGGWYKEFYATHALNCARIYVFPRTAKNVAAVTLHAGASALSDLAGAVLDRLDLRERLRRLMRRRSTEAA